MDAKKAEDLAKKLWANTTLGDFWSEEALVSWLRCDCKCAYCKEDMLKSRDVAYFFSTTLEHLLPKKKYPGLEKEPSNLVLACRACNSRKGQWDPNRDGEPIYTASEGTQLTEEQRQELIERAKKYIKTKQVEHEKLFSQEKKLLLEAMENN